MTISDDSFQLVCIGNRARCQCHECTARRELTAMARSAGVPIGAPELDDPAHAARVRIASRALGDALAGETYEQRVRAVLAVAEALGVSVSVLSNPARGSSRPTVQP